MEWWTAFVHEVDVSGPLEANASHPADLSPFALGDNLSDIDGGWNSSDEDWEEERLWSEREASESSESCGGTVCVCGAILTNSEDTQSWWSDSSQHFVLSCGRLSASGNSRLQR